jgi:Icc-related predicted phosphoesterase
MRILAFSDWHVQPLEWAVDIVRREKPDIILYAGDALRKFIPPNFNVPFYYVNGNDARVFVAHNKYYLRSYSEKCPQINPTLGKSVIQHGKEKIRLYGIGCTSGLQSRVKNAPTEYADIFLSHIPPLGILDLSVRHANKPGGKHIGSKELLNAIKKYHPRFVICGHSHIWGGLSRKIGKTTVINVSSNDKEGSYGNYAVIDTKDWSFKPKTMQSPWAIRGLRDFRKKVAEKLFLCTNTAEQRLLDKVWDCRTYKDVRRLITLAEKFGIDSGTLKERIASINWKRPKIKSQISLDPERRTFVDVETGLSRGEEPGKLWLIGLLHAGNLKQFIIPQQKAEFLRFIRENYITSLVSWSQYDGKALRPLLKRARIKMSFLDACQRAAYSCVWHSYKLENLHQAFFGKKSGDDLILGRIAGLYADHLIIPNKHCPHCPDKAKLVEQIKKKNRADLIRMIEVCKALRKEPKF